MKKNITAVILFLYICLVGKAGNIIVVNGLEYTISGAYACLYGVANNNTQRIIAIPSTLYYNGQTYTVNALSDACFCNYFENYNGKRFTIVDGVKSEGAPYCEYTKGELIDAERRANNCSFLRTVILPNTIESIGYYSFSNSNLSSIKLNEGITTISGRAFYLSKISSIVIPSSVQNMGKNTFDDCNLLHSITYLGSKPPTYWTATSKTYVPSKKWYGTPYYAINNANIIEIISFSNNSFIYTGKVPQVSWTNNYENYFVTMDMPTLFSEVGTYELFIPATLTKGEETFTAIIPYEYTICPAKLHVSVDDVSRTYGEPNPDFNISYFGFVNDEDESVLTDKPKVQTDANITSDVGTYALAISGGKAKNYEIEYTNGILTITKASLFIKVMDVVKIYGKNNPSFGLQYFGLKNGEEEPTWIIPPTVITDATKMSDVGDYIVSITCKPKNYEVVSITPGTLTIEPALLSITVKDTIMEYGSNLPSFMLLYSGFVNGQNIDVLTRHPSVKTEATTTSNVGSYPVTPFGAEAKNYTITYHSGILRINPRLLTVKANSYYRAYGDENPELTVAYSGFVNNETKNVLDKEPVCTTTATIRSNVGTYDIVVSGGKAMNYIFSYQAGTLTITPRSLLVYVDDYERPYGEDNPVFTIIYEGFVGNDTSSSLSPQPIVRTSATKHSPVGVYDITVTGGYSSNYILSYRKGTLTIVKAEQSFEWDQDLSNLEVGMQVELLAKASSGLPITYTVDDNSYADIYIAGSRTFMECNLPGSFSLKAVQEGNENYYSTQRITKKVHIVSDNGISTAQTINANIQVMPFGIRITGVDNGMLINIYSDDGIILNSAKANNQQTDIILRKDKVYIIKIKDRVIKISL